MEIDVKLLKRTYKLTKGIYKGEHICYLNKAVANIIDPHIKVLTWGNKECLEAVAGNWIEALDGFVIQLLRIRKYISKASGVPHYFFRFPMCVVSAYINKSGTIRFREFYGQFTYPNKNRVSAAPDGDTARKIRFASLVVSGLNPILAYTVGFNDRQLYDTGVINYKVNRLMNDKIVQKEIINQLEPLINQMSKSFSDLRIVNELDELLTRSKKGSDTHRDNIKFILELLGKMPERMSQYKKNSKIKDAEEVTFEEQKPPSDE